MSKPIIHKDNISGAVIKSLDQETGMIEGWASAYGVKDSDDEYVDKNCFQRSLSHNAGKVPILFGHDRNQVAGWAHSGVESDKGLFVTGKLALETEVGKKAYYFLKGAMEAGATDYATLSIGFVPDKNGIYKDDSGDIHYRSAALKEWSVVPFASNPEATITSVKQCKEYLQAMPELAEKADPKTKRVDGKDLTSDQFAYVGDEDDTSTWKLPVHDAAHVRNALSRFSQTEGIPDSEKDAVLAKIKRAAEKFGIDVSESKGEFPMLLPNISVEQALAAVKGNEAGLSEEQKQSFAALRTVLAEMVKKDLGVAPAQKDDGDTADGGSDPMSFEDAMSSRQAVENLENDRYNLENARHKSVHSILNSDCSKADKQQMLHKSLHSFADAMVAHHMKQLDTQDKYGKQASQSFPQVKGMNTEDHLKNQRKLGKAMSELDAHSAMNAVAANNTAMAADHAKRALNMMRDVARSYAANDVNLPNPEGTKAEKEQIERFKSSDVTLLVSALAVPVEP